MKKKKETAMKPKRKRSHVLGVGYDGDKWTWDFACNNADGKVVGRIFHVPCISKGKGKKYRLILEEI